MPFVTMGSDIPGQWFNDQPRGWQRYGAALFFVVIAFGLRSVFDASLGEAHQFPFFLAAAAVAAWYGGLGPALLTLVLGYLLADWFFIFPRRTFGGLTALGGFALATYAFTGLVMSIAVTAGRAATRRTREIALQVEHERERFRVTLLSIGDAVIATDQHGMITFLNPVAEQITGWTHHEAYGKPLQTIFKIYNEITRQPIDDPVAKVLEQGIVVGLANHTILVTKSGQDVPIDDSAAPIRDNDGNLAGAILVFRDVTEQRKADLAVRRLAAIVEGSEDAILSKNLRGTVTSWNRGAERIYGYSSKEMIGRPIGIVIPPDRQNEEEEILAKIQRGERIDHFETVRQTKDGRQIHVSLSASPIRDSEGEIQGVSKIARDITERKRIEQALRESNARNEAILQSALDGIIVIDHASRVLEFNAAAEKIFGFKRSEVIGQSMAERIIPERLRARHYHGLAKYLETGEGPVLSRRIELPALRANGEEFPAELAIVPIPGSPPSFTGFLRDLTEQKRAEAELKKAREDLLNANRGLEKKVQERTASLEQSVKSIETLLYTIAHDLRSPNRAMQGFASLLTDEYSDRLDDTAQSYLKRISAAALKNDTLICDLLEYGRLAHADLPMARVDVRNCLEKVIHDLQPQIASSDAIIDVAGAQPWPAAWANDSVLSQILTNLLSNALKFVAPGVSPRMRIWVENSTLNSKPSLKLFIEDNGIGIPPEIRHRLFEPFQRGTSGSHYQGTGMGLAIVQKGAERLGGKVGFSSNPGRGTCFWLELPLATD
jgi:PAS domain S-box-containing protein